MLRPIYILVLYIYICFPRTARLVDGELIALDPDNRKGYQRDYYLDNCKSQNKLDKDYGWRQKKIKNQFQLDFVQAQNKLSSWTSFATNI